MTEAEKAYEAAERLIAEAAREGWDELDFDEPEFRALEAIPPIAHLTGITTLDLDNTRVSDLSSIARSIAIETLRLSNTQVNDLSPIAGMTRITTLRLSNTKVSDLSPIAGFKGITTLFLGYSQVTDLSPLAGMTGITTLSLGNTQVTDLSPLVGMTGVITLDLENTPLANLRNLPPNVQFSMLDVSGTQIADLRPLLDVKLREIRQFTLRVGNTPAAKSDPRIAEIDTMEDHEARVKALLAHLADGWVPADERNSNGPAPDNLLPVDISGDRLEIAASLPTEAERDERLKAALHERLRPKTQDLARLAGNQYMRLAARARALTTQVDCDFAELDMLLIHLEFADLAELSKIGAEDDLEFTPEIVAALNDVLRLGPGLTLDNPDVELMLERERRLREDPQPQDVQDAHDKLSDEISKNDEIFGDRLRTIEAQNAQMPSVLSADAAQTAVHRNVLLRIWRLTVDTGSISALGISALTFIFAQWPSVFPIVTSYGSFFADWFLAAIGSLPQTPTGLQGLPKQPDERTEAEDDDDN